MTNYIELDNESVAERLQYIKMREELTYKQIAEMTGISIHTIEFVFKTGHCNINTLYAICKGLGISSDWVLGLKKNR